MTIQQQLDEDIKQAMRSGDAVRRDVLRFLKSAIHNEEIARREPLNDEAALAVVAKQVKQRRESIDMFRQGGRDDLVAKEEGELAILQVYLPEQLGDVSAAKERLTILVKGPHGNDDIRSELSDHPKIKTPQDYTELLANKVWSICVGTWTREIGLPADEGPESIFA